MKFVDKLDFEIDEPPLTEPNPADFIREQSYPRPNPHTKSVFGLMTIYNAAGHGLVEFPNLEFVHVPDRKIHCAYNLVGTAMATGKADRFLLTLFLPKKIIIRGEVADRGSRTGLRLGNRHITAGSTMKINFFEVSGMKGE